MTQVFLSNPLEVKFIKVVWIDCECVALSVETINFVFLFIIKAFVREVLLIAALNFISDRVIMMHLDASLIKLWLSYDSLVSYVPDEMVVGVGIRVKEVDKHSIFGNPATGDEWVRKVIVDHGVVIEANQLVYFHLGFIDLLLISLLFAKDTETKQPIVEVDTGKLLPIMVLFHLFYPDVLLLVTSDLFLKSLFESLNRVHFDPTLIFHVL